MPMVSSSSSGVMIAPSIKLWPSALRSRLPNGRRNRFISSSLDLVPAEMRSNGSAARRRSRKQRWNNDFDKRGAAGGGPNADAFVRVKTEVVSWVKSQAPSSKSQHTPKMPNLKPGPTPGDCAPDAGRDLGFDLELGRWAWLGFAACPPSLARHTRELWRGVAEART